MYHVTELFRFSSKIWQITRRIFATKFHVTHIKTQFKTKSRAGSTINQHVFISLVVPDEQEPPSPPPGLLLALVGFVAPAVHVPPRASPLH